MYLSQLKYTFIHWISIFANYYVPYIFLGTEQTIINVQKKLPHEVCILVGEVVISAKGKP